MNWIYNLLNRATKFASIYKLNKMLLIISLAFISSCTKDVLDKIPLTSYSDATVWKDASLIDGFISNTYRVFPIGWSILANLSDECNRRNNVGYATINSGNLTPSSTTTVNYWSNTSNTGGDGYTSSGYYDVIKRCNIFFEKYRSGHL